MSALKTYLNNLVCELFPENGFVEDAVEHAILQGHIRIVMDKEKDTKEIMNNYDSIIEHYRIEVQQHRALLWESYAPILEAIKEAGRVKT